MKKNKNLLVLIISLFAFIMLVGGVSYSYFIYSNDVVTADLSSGNISINFTSSNNSLVLSNILPMADNLGKMQEDYLDFTVVGVADIEQIKYEVQIIPNDDNTLNGDHIQLYLTDQSDNEIVEPINYNNLSIATKNNGKIIYSDKISGNSDGTSKTTTRDFRLRIWVDDSYTETEAKTFGFSIYLYAENFDISNSIYVELRKNVQTSSTINFNEASGPDNGEGLYILKGTETDTYPIYYYRGAVDDNNVLFGGFCWQIVRTTETGGIKMIYNGVATGDGETCENTEGASRQLATTSAFNSSHTSPSYAGYMYNQVYAYTNNAEVEGAYFGSGVSHNGSTYTLTGVYTDNDNTVKAAKDSDHHYTCNDASSYECPQVRYYYYNDYYITLTNGDTIEDALYKMTGNGSNETKTKNALYTLNQTSSLAKQNIETWFKTNLTNEEDETKTNYQAYLEDTIFCNDRSYKTVGSSSTYNQSGWNPNGGDLSKYLFFGSNNRIHNSWYSATNIPALKNEGEFPNIACPNETDRFSVGSTVAHLNYPVGLLTADEIVLAGASGNNGSIADNPFYLYTGEIYWSFTPYNFYSGYVGEFIIDADGCMKNLKVSYNRGLRPVISLKLGTEFEPGGEGTTTNPYKVKIN